MGKKMHHLDRSHRQFIVWRALEKLAQSEVEWAPAFVFVLVRAPYKPASAASAVGKLDRKSVV